MPLSRIPEEHRDLQKIQGCDNNDRAFDVVFIHGLGGDSWTTWMADDKKPETFWPAWLADLFPEGGFWTLGYAAAKSKWQQQSLPHSDRAKQLLDLLVVNGLGKRPLIFIAHSMGGILAKQILRTSSDGGVPRYKSIAENTRGIGFLATPHSGSDTANMAALVKSLYRTNPQVIELVSDSAYLRDLHNWFRGSPILSHLVCRTYAEGWYIEPDNPWIKRLFQVSVRIVSPSSSEPGIPGEDAIFLDAHHIGIVKPESRDAQVFSGMKLFIDDCKTKIATLGSQASSEIESVVRDILPAELSQQFTYSAGAALTESDTAGIALIAALIERKAEADVRVIGRGTRLVDSRTEAYLTAVAKAILRGISYTRILLIDPDLPQNALLWLLFFERFLGSADRRDLVHLYKKKLFDSNTSQQFQIVDRKFVHIIVRYYSKEDPKAAPRAQSTFAVKPNLLVEQQWNIYENHLRDAGLPYRHKDVFELLTRMLHSLDAENQNMSYHWQHALEAVTFLNNLKVEGMPLSRIKFVGCLMPFTFTYDAAQRFACKMNKESQGDRIIALPFPRLDDAIAQFQARNIAYICMPVSNTRVDNLAPPTVSAPALNSLKDGSPKVDEIEIALSFVLAGVYTKSANWKRLAAVNAAFDQVKSRLPKPAGKLKRVTEVESNYHAAVLAKQDPSIVAITTPQAAEFLKLHSYKELCTESEGNRTKFAIFSL